MQDELTKAIAADLGITDLPLSRTTTAHRAVRRDRAQSRDDGGARKTF